MAKELKKIPFNVGIAKKIQDGTIKGRICTDAGEPAEIIDFDLAPGTNYPLGVKYYDCGSPKLSNFAKDGECLADVGTSTYYNTLFLEIEADSFECPFEPFQKILVRSKETRNFIWQAAFFSHFEESTGLDYYVTTAGDRYLLEDEVIPYEGNEHLLGTDEEYK